MRRLFLLFISVLFVCSGISFSKPAKPVFNNVEPESVIVNETEDIDISAAEVENDLSVVNLAAKKKMVHIGGTPIGIALKNRGLIIIGKTEIITEFGLKSTVKNSDIQNGDTLMEVEGREVNTATELSNIINEEKFQGKTLDITLKRAGKEVKTVLEPQLDAISKKYKAGLWVREETFGIGTLTYIKLDDKRFGALGHPVADPDTGEAITIKGGSVSGCNITGIVKGARGKAGELKGNISRSDVRGAIDKNNTFGIFGSYTDGKYKSIYKDPVQVMPHKDVKPGKAKIITTLDGGSPKEYDIEIIRSLNPSKPSDKNLVIRITDEELLEKTGGIVQGMSGSPIIQKGKLCGAVTHVFINDPTKGYGIFADYMLEN